MSDKGLGRKFREWMAVGAGICASVALAWTAASYAAAAFWNLPNAVSGTQVSASAWNDIVSQVNTLATSSGGIGVGQTWKDVTGSRANGTAYTNTTGKPIFVSVSVVNTNTVSAEWGFVDGIQVALVGSMDDRRSIVSFIVPNGSSYYVGWNGSNSLVTWAELR